MIICRFGADLEKNELHELCRIQLFVRFSAKLVNFSANLGIGNNIKNVIFIAWNAANIWIYYVYSRVISLSHVKRKKKNALRLNITFRHLRIFSANLYSQNFRVIKKMFFPSLVWRKSAINNLINYLMSNRGVCRTAPFTPGLLKI